MSDNAPWLSTAVKPSGVVALLPIIGVSKMVPAFTSSNEYGSSKNAKT
jgi:hypothetical protein